MFLLFLLWHIHLLLSLMNALPSARYAQPQHLKGMSASHTLRAPKRPVPAHTLRDLATMHASQVTCATGMPDSILTSGKGSTGRTSGKFEIFSDSIFAAPGARAFLVHNE